MTDATAGRGGVGIRLFVQGGEVVRRTFDQVGDSGKKMWAEIALGERAANPAIRALSVGAGEARGAIDGLAGRAGPAGAALGAFGAAGLAAGAALGALAISLVKVREGMQFAADLTDTADRIGIGAESLQEFRYVADEAGVSVESFQSSLERLNGQVGAFRAGIGDARLRPIFEELGITKDQLANVKDAGDMVMLLADTLGQVSDRAVQVRLAKGLGVEESLPILRLGSEEIRRLSSDARDLGLVMSDEVRSEFDEADRAMERAQQRIDMALKVSVVGLADDFAGLVEAIADAVQWLGRLEDRIGKFDIDDNPATRAGQFVNDQVRGWLGMGRNTERANRLALENGWVTPAGEWNRSDVSAGLQDLARPERPGFDLRGHTSGGGRGSSASRQANREAEQRRQREERADQQLERSQREIDRSYDRGNLSINDRAAYEVSDLELERADRLREIARAEEEYVRSNGLRGLTEAEAEQLRAKQAELTEQRKSVIEWERRRAIAEERVRTEEEAGQAAVDLLDIDAQMVRTQKERSRIEREILLATVEIARKRRQFELDNDPNLDDETRRQRMGEFERNAGRQVQLFDHQESERLREQFKGYGREVVQAIQDGRIGEYIGDKLKERLLDGALDQLFNLFSMGAKAGAKGGGWMSAAFSAIGSIFGGGRAAGGDTRAGRFYATVEHGRPELFMLGGQGQVTSAAETVRMLEESLGGSRAVNTTPVVQQTLHNDFRGAVVTEDLIRQMDERAERAKREAVEQSAALARRGAPGVQRDLHRLGTSK